MEEVQSAIRAIFKLQNVLTRNEELPAILRRLESMRRHGREKLLVRIR